MRATTVLVLGVLTALSAPAGGFREDRAVPAAAARRDLVDGNARFVAGTPTVRTDLRARREALAASQKPDAIVLACSDSRVAPEILFDQSIGDLFVVRVAGAVLGAEELASVEYAVEHLGTNLVVVLGHSSCGAVKTAISTPAGTSAGSPALDHLVGEIRGNLAGADLAVLAAEPGLIGAARANARAVARELLERSAIVRSHAGDRGPVRVVAAVYDLESGRVELVDDPAGGLEPPAAR